VITPEKNIENLSEKQENIVDKHSEAN